MPVGARFFAPIQTGPGANAASCTMGTGSFPVVKCGVDHPLLSSALWAFVACCRVNFESCWVILVLIALMPGILYRVVL
jgi:hypothetical protein